MVKSPAKKKKKGAVKGKKKKKPAAPPVPDSSDEESAQHDEVLATAEDDEVSQLLEGMDIEGSPEAPMESPVTPRSPADSQSPDEQHAEEAAVVTTEEHPAQQQHAADATVAAAGEQADEGEQAEQLEQQDQPAADEPLAGMRPVISSTEKARISKAVAAAAQRQRQAQWASEQRSRAVRDDNVLRTDLPPAVQRQVTIRTAPGRLQLDALSRELRPEYRYWAEYLWHRGISHQTYINEVGERPQDERTLRAVLV